MNTLFARTVCAPLAVATLAMSMPAPAAAGVVGTEDMLRDAASASTVPIDRDTLRALLDRDDVRSRLEALGVDPRAARDRVDALTDDEVGRLAGQVEQLPAGGASVIGVLFAVFVILLITDILGLTRIFPFTRPIR
ncbi:MAG: hypothetical protein EHM87_09925 [Burkholderiales bacterium]|nr:MAG: hypothetical protein EHM87_09925 [Burkholderiales bacterium]